jgi:glycosyltransferase involved in cell wall biosynthesis
MAPGRSGRVVVVNSTRDYLARPYADGDLRWGPPGDYALALRAMHDNGLDVREVVAPALADVADEADLYYVRDWRYSRPALAGFVRAHPLARTVLDLRINPVEVHTVQRRAEQAFWLGRQAVDPAGVELPYSSDVLGLPAVTFVGSALNRRLLEELGRHAGNMRTRPHVTPWVLRAGRIEALQAARRQVDYGRFRALFVGRSLFRKGLPRLFRALTLSGLPGWELVAVTDGVRGGVAYDDDDGPLEPQEIVGEMLAHPGVRWVPWGLNPGEMIALYHSCHLHVCPSLCDNGPNTVIESMVCGLPVLLSDMCGAAESVPAPYRVQFRVPKWWRREDLAGCDEELAAALAAYYENIFATRQVVEYGEALRRAYMSSGALERLYAEYREVFHV